MCLICVLCCSLVFAIFACCSFVCFWLFVFFVFDCWLWSLSCASFVLSVCFLFVGVCVVLLLFVRCLLGCVIGVRMIVCWLLFLLLCY